VSDALLFVVVVLAAYRVWRFFALDDLPPVVAARDAFENRIQRRHGAAWSDGLMCVWCSGWWASCAVVGVVWALRPLPLPGLWFLAVAAAVGLAGMTLED
jgi:hypothetical protein